MRNWPYYFFTHFILKKRKKIRSWSLRAKADVLDRIENLKEVNENLHTENECPKCHYRW